MKTRHSVKFVAAACAALASSAVLAAPPVVPQVVAGDRIALTSTPWGGANGGGEFTATTVPGYGNGPSFNTFCIEYNEHFYYTQTLYVGGVTKGAKSGGSGGAVLDPNTPNPTDTWDPVDYRTAYLFTKFTKQALTNYEFGGTTAAQIAEHKRDSESLQLAIWFIEQEIGSTFAANSGELAAYNKYIAVGGSGIGDEARAFVADAAAANWSSVGYVRALNLYSNASYTGAAQDQLYLQPIPEPETYAMMLAGLGLIGFVAGRRRRKLG